MGNGSSKLDKALSDLPESERVFGLENFGNTCYCNSVVQALYFCPPFRENVLKHAARDSSNNDESLLTCLAELFEQILSQKRRTGSIAPRRFVERVKRENEMFRSYMHQDAHEFFMFLLSSIGEILEAAHKRSAAATIDDGQPYAAPVSFVTEIFQGKTVTKIKCLQCESVTDREEPFMDLGVEIEQPSSLDECLHRHSHKELMDKDDKFHCDTCGCKQEAQRWVCVKQLPRVLVVHLKRFKFLEQLGRMRKLLHKVEFPQELTVPSSLHDAMPSTPTSSSAASTPCSDAAATPPSLTSTSSSVGSGSNAVYDLFAVIVHIGSGPHHGHYVCLVNSHGQWLMLDDDVVLPVDETALADTFGSEDGTLSTEQHGYILFYNRRDLASVETGSSGPLNADLQSSP